MSAVIPVNELDLPAALMWHPAPLDAGATAICRSCATLRDGVLCWATLPEHARWTASLQPDRGDALGASEIARLLDRLLEEA